MIVCAFRHGPSIAKAPAGEKRCVNDATRPIARLLFQSIKEGFDLRIGDSPRATDLNSFQLAQIYEAIDLRSRQREE